MRGEHKAVKDNPKVPMHDAGLASIEVDRKSNGYFMFPFDNEMA